jgi:hypothetical protein
MDLGLDDLPFLAFLVPLDPTKKGPKVAGELTSIFSASLGVKGFKRMPLLRHDNSMPVIVLTRGRVKGKQMAVATTRDETGYIDMRKDHTDLKVWRPLMTFPLEEGGYVAIYERRSSAPVSDDSSQ